MADNKLIGQNYTTPDLVAKVTGKAKYAEDYRVEGMLFAKILSSPMPHARVRRLDTSKALAMEGVKAILTADDMPGAAAGATLGEGVQASAQAERGLTNEPLYHGEPILAVAAVDEATAAAAIEAIEIDLEPLPFVVDALEGLRPVERRRRRRRRRAADPDTDRPRRRAARHRAWCRSSPGAKRQRAGRASRPRTRRGSRSPRAAADRGVEVDRPGLRRRAGRPDADGQADRRVDLRQPRGGLQESRSRPRGNLHDAVDRPPAARDAHGDGAVAERQAVSARLDPEHGADGRLGGALDRRHARQGVHHQRVHGRRLRQQDPGLDLHGDPGAAVEEGQRAGDDAHHSRRRALHRPRTPGHPGAREDGLPQ